MTDPKNIHIAFTSKTLDYVANVLAQRPYAEVSGLLDDLRQQLAQQQAPAGGPLPELHESPTATQ